MILLSLLPTNCNHTAKTLEGKWRECVAYQERLRLEFNRYGGMRRSGEATQKEWETYISDEYEPRMDSVSDEIHNLRKLVIAADVG